MKYRTLIIHFIICFLSVSSSLAAESNIDSLKTQQKQLQSILNDIEKTSQERTQHSQQIKRLKHQLECNWSLIRSYEICGQNHENSPADHLDCLSTAKRAATTCLSSDPQK